MAYATVDDVQARLTYTMTADQRTACAALLDDAAVLIDAYTDDVPVDTAKVVSCRMVARAIGDGSTSGIPTGASQGSMSALGYSQSWTMTGGATGEVYLTKIERKMLGVGDHVGSWSPVQEFASEYDKTPAKGKKTNVIGIVDGVAVNVSGDTGEG